MKYCSTLQIHTTYHSDALSQIHNFTVVSPPYGPLTDKQLVKGWVHIIICAILVPVSSKYLYTNIAVLEKFNAMYDQLPWKLGVHSKLMYGMKGHYVHLDDSS